MRPDQLRGSDEKRRCGAVVLAVDRAPAGCGQSRGGAIRQRRIGLPELCQVADGLFEVVAHDLVSLDER